MDMQFSNNPDFSDHSRFRLQITVGHSGVRANFFDPKARAMFPYMDKNWHCDPIDALKKIEDAFYEDTILLDDYDTRILIRPNYMLFRPADSLDADDDDAANSLISTLDAAEEKDVWTENCGDITAVFSTPAGLRDFLHRSFLTENVKPAILPLLNARRSATDTTGKKIFVHLDAQTLDIVATDNGAPALINTRAYTDAPDAAYYIIYSLTALGFDPSRTEIMLSGPSPLRRELLPMLRRHAGHVTNALLPLYIKQALEKGVSLSEALFALS